MTTSEHPFDTSQLHKGSFVDASTIEQAYGVRRGTDEFRLASLRGKQFIEERFEARGLIVVVVIRDEGLAILTDAEASTNREKRIKSSLRGAKRALVQMGAVDRSKLAPERLPQHDRQFEVLGRALSAADRERKIAPPPPTVRNTPARLASASAGEAVNGGASEGKGLNGQAGEGKGSSEHNKP